MNGGKDTVRAQGFWRRIPPLVWLIVATALALPALLGGAYGLDILGYPATWWRDHPFDYGNMLHLADTISWRTRLWAWDPLHMFGWTPHVFYNPLATLLAVIFCWPLGLTPAAYKLWLMFLLLLTSLAGYLLLPRRLPGWSRICGGALFAWTTLIVFPGDVGILDANPVQVLYTGQWAQRLGIFFGMGALAVWLRAWEMYLESSTARPVGAGRFTPHGWKTALPLAGGAALTGASLFSHFMSGYAVLVVLVSFALWRVTADRLVGRGWHGGRLLMLAALFAFCLLLWFDFFHALFSLNGRYHSLPLLRWRVPQGAHMVVVEPLLAMIPVLLLSLLGLVQKPRNVSALAEALFPLVVLAVTVSSTGSSQLPLFLFLAGLSLLVVRVTGKAAWRFFLPVAAAGTWLLACGPDSLIVGGVDFSGLIPFAGSMGWAKLAAFSRWLWLAWLALIAAEQLSAARTLMHRALVGVGVTAAFTLPLVLSLNAKEGAQVFFEWMNHTDHPKTEEVLERIGQVARQIPADGYLLVQDTLHHDEDSLLGGREVPFGHLPYLVARTSGRPVLGGTVTTRYVTHPLTDTARHRIMCSGADGGNLSVLLKQLGETGVSDLLIHEKTWIAALREQPAVQFIDQRRGLAHFRLTGKNPLVRVRTGSVKQLRWSAGALDVVLGPGTDGIELGLVPLPVLRCRGLQGNPCEMESAKSGKVELSGCLLDEPNRKLEIDPPRLSLALGRAEPREQVLHIESRPAVWPLLVMMLSWLALLVGGVLEKLHRRSNS